MAKRKNNKPANCKECKFAALCMSGIGTCKKYNESITAYDWCAAGRKK